MNHDRTRQRRLDAIMRANKMTSAEVARVIGRTPAHVRKYRSGMQPVPEPLLRLLELELASTSIHRGG